MGVVRARVLACAAAAIVATTTTAVPEPVATASTPRVATVCASGLTTAELNGLFAGRVDDYNGMDSVRVFPLPDGRNLWLVQDAFLSRDGNPRTLIGNAFAHNAALVQDGSCFRSLHGPTETDGVCVDGGAVSYVGGALTINCWLWFWAMGGGIGEDGALHVFFAKIVNPNGTGAAAGAAPQEVWRARIDVRTLEVLSFAPAVDAGADILYGWGVESDANYTFLFGHSFDQFVRPDPGLALPNETYVARIPKGRFGAQPDYWDGVGWSTVRAAARPIRVGSGRTHALQPRLIDGVWVSVAKVDEWFGAEMIVDTAPAPQGPWNAVRSIVVPAKTISGSTNNYAPHLLPWRAPNGNLVVAMSHNAWNMNPVVYTNPYLYRPTFFEIEPPDAMPRARFGATSELMGFVPSPPRRAIDTRVAASVGARQTLRVPLVGLTAAGARAAALNVVAVDPQGDGFLTAFSCDRTRPWISTVNFATTSTRGAASIVELSASSEVCVYASAATHVVVDVFGSYVDRATPGASSYRGGDPVRVHDSRVTGGALVPDVPRRIAVATGATAAALNVAVTEPSAAGYVTVYPCDQPRPPTASVNAGEAQTVSNFAQVGLSPTGEVCVVANVPTHVVIDLLGTFGSWPDGWWYQTTAPTRLMDTREGLGAPVGLVARPRPLQSALPAASIPALTAVPPEARALVVTVVAVQPVRSGWTTVAPCSPAYATAALNSDAWQTVANTTIAATRPATGRDVCVFSFTPAYQVLDLVGWYSAAA